MKFNKDYVLRIAKELLSIDSPTGYTNKAIEYLEKEVNALGYTYSRNAKGNLIVSLKGTSDYTIGLCAHTDTLGLMVRSISSDGTLALTNLGGPLIPTLDAEYCRIHTREGNIYTGTILANVPASHVYPDAATKERKIENMLVRIDEVVKTKEDTEKLGIQNGDFVAIDPKVEITKSDFIKSRFLDDKISVSILMGVLEAIKTNNIELPYNVEIIFSTYEEVGHGSSSIPSNINELLAVDMGCIGLDLACTEYDVSICAKDSSGPYDYNMTTKLVNLAKANKLSYAVDIYPYYGSDVSAALSGGNNIRGALIGPGVHASHGMERTHYQAVEQTMQLVYAYITDKDLA
ncbi:putative aminopeptidase FrvX [Breznakia blatticola]|uniref:Putative aminopeptidase FrvX n=1 Tax=Breznakia blatticola TaxID=1754012 RepID=A0A4R7ZG76_9FIRM|nr:M42 family metallopeptidase [Breznakia blatticola]TDW16312.1 putative aminopeptidase FrvX [Breznakia blatticola]